MTKRVLTRRHLLGNMAATAAGVTLANTQQGCRSAAAGASRECLGDPAVRGPFPILSTPFTETGAVDYDVLAKQAQFVARCGSPGMIWPQSADSLDLLTMEEKLQGMEALAAATKGSGSALCLGVQGKDTEEMLIYARHAEKLAPAAVISRPPDNGKTEADLRDYWQALARVANRPVILQTTGGTAYKGVTPSVKFMVELARELPHFGYIKEESGPVWARMQEEIAAKPVIKRVFSAWGGWGWLHQSRLGTEGLITERCAYADLLAHIWRLMERRPASGELAAAFGVLLTMLNMRETIPGGDLRGPHLYVFMRRGVFKNMVSRNYGPNNSVPDKPKISEVKLLQIHIDEIEMRLAMLRSYLKTKV